MSDYISDVKAFQDRFGLEMPTSFTLLNDELHKFRLKFLREEFDEYVLGCKTDDLALAIDSLIDLVYVVCGTLLFHGVTPEKFKEIVVDEDDRYLLQTFAFRSSYEDEPYHPKPTFLSPETNSEITAHLSSLIDHYGSMHETAVLNNSIDDEGLIVGVLTSIYLTTLECATLMGFSLQAWDELWDDVQRANMSKERATKASQSKRGTAYDVIKPPGWVGPRTEEILAKYL